MFGKLNNKGYLNGIPLLNSKHHSLDTNQTSNCGMICSDNNVDEGERG